jgi:hypothetical protein
MGGLSHVRLLKNDVNIAFLYLVPTYIECLINSEIVSFVPQELYYESGVCH